MDACRHARKRETFYWERDQLMDRITDQFMIIIGPDRSDEEEEHEGEEEEDETNEAPSTLASVQI